MQHVLTVTNGPRNRKEIRLKGVEAEVLQRQGEVL